MEEQLDQESEVPETGSHSEDLGPEPETETETETEEPVPKRAKKHKSSKCGTPLYMYFLQNSKPFDL